MKHMMLRGVSVWLALITVFCMLPAVTFAETTESEPVKYTHSFASALPNFEGANVVLKAYNNDATDSWDLQRTSASADREAFCLKTTFNPPRTHLTFTFEAPTVGTYYIAFEYRAAFNANFDRRIGFQVDSLGIEQLSLQMPKTDVTQFAIVEIALEAGSHTFTMYAPENQGKSLEDGRSIQSCDLYAYTVWTAAEALAMYDSSVVTALPDMTDMTTLKDLGNTDADEIWEGGDKSGWGANEKITLDATKTHLTFNFTTEHRAVYYIGVQYAKSVVDESKAPYLGFRIDDFSTDRIALTASADSDSWMIVTIQLTPGEHSFTVSAPIGLGKNDSNGKTVVSPELLAYKIWSVTVLPPYNYQYTIEDKLTDTVPALVVLDCGVKGANDSWDLEYTQSRPDGVGLMLKPDFDPPRTHLGFTFTVKKAGEYKIAIQYDASVNASLDRSVDVQIDKLGRTRISPTPTDTQKYLVITQYLDAGEHKLTLYSPNAFGVKNDAGQTVHSCTLYSFMVYMPIAPEGLLSMVSGAAVRMSSVSSLRYTTRVDKDLYDSLVDIYGAENVSVGTLFGSAADAATLGTLTKESFNKEAFVYYDSAKAELLKDDNGYYFYGYWEESDTSKYGDMMSAVGYVRVIIEGKSKYIYATYNAENDRSIALVAQRAIADTKSASEAGYENSVTANGATLYSPYTQSQYACLVKLAAFGKED